MDRSLPVCGKLKDAGTMTSGSADFLARGAGALDQRPARLDEHRQDDEEIAGDEGGNERVARQAEDVARPDRRHRRHHAGQHPQGDEERNANVGDEKHLQPADLIEAERSGGYSGNGEETVRRQLDDEAGGARECDASHAQDVEQDRLAYRCR